MIIEPFRRDDIGTFLELAISEGWVAEAWEFDFLLTAFPQGCYAARDDNGETLAFVTAIRHENSGWIGNLIVKEQVRGRGIGEALFRKSLDALQAAGAETYWLTASKSGRSLYEKHGFSSLDTIMRWTGNGHRRDTERADQSGSPHSSSSASGIDCLAWGDRRDALLAAVAGRGRLLLEESGFVVLQPSGAAMQLGPFAALDSSSAERIFTDALASVPPGTKIYVDAPASNITAQRLYSRRAMQISGSTELMYAGVKPSYQPDLLYGLASMGSMG
jgi:ribosomal protein S18 acetylase RimI-like enzyme